jgi:thiol-disulfide isomerase/thioredoxin
MKTFLTAILLVALSALALAQNGEEMKAMPKVNLADFDGKAVASDSFKGSIVVVDFWATWCGPCIVEIPEYNRLQAKYADKGVKFLGVTMASGAAKEVKPFIEKFQMKYTVLMGNDDQGYEFNIIGFPTTYLVTRDWKILRKYVGAGPRKIEQLEADIQKLLDREKQ